MRFDSRCFSAVAAIAAGVAVSPVDAAADTYLVVVNALTDPIKLNGKNVASDTAMWTALDAVVTLPGGEKYNLRDVHEQCPSGGWEIRAEGPRSTHYCIELGFMEVGCILAGVRQNEGDEVPWIDMDKVALGVCSDSWWNTAGKAPIDEIAGIIRETGTAIAQAAAALKSK